MQRTAETVAWPNMTTMENVAYARRLKVAHNLRHSRLWDRLNSRLPTNVWPVRCRIDVRYCSRLWRQVVNHTSDGATCNLEAPPKAERNDLHISMDVLSYNFIFVMIELRELAHTDTRKFLFDISRRRFWEVLCSIVNWPCAQFVAKTWMKLADSFKRWSSCWRWFFTRRKIYVARHKID